MNFEFKLRVPKNLSSRLITTSTGHHAVRSSQIIEMKHLWCHSDNFEVYGVKIIITRLVIVIVVHSSFFFNH